MTRHFPASTRNFKPRHCLRLDMALESDEHLISPHNITLLKQTFRSREWRSWSPTKEALYCFNKSFQQLRKCTQSIMKNMHIDVKGCKGLRMERVKKKSEEHLSTPSCCSEHVIIFHPPRSYTLQSVQCYTKILLPVTSLHQYAYSPYCDLHIS